MPDHDTRVVIKKTNAINVSSEIIVQRSVISDHLPSTFDMACKCARETLMLEKIVKEEEKVINNDDHIKQNITTKEESSNTIQETISTKDLWNEFSSLKLQPK